MSRFGTCCLALVCLAAPVRSAEPLGKLLHETWDAAYLDGHKAGWFQTTVREIGSDGQTIIRTTLDMVLTVRRFKETVTMRMETGTDETPQGKVTGVFMRQYLGKQQQLVLVGVVMGDFLHVKVNGMMNMERKVPWNEKVVGLYRQQRLFADRQVKPGDQLSYLSYEPAFNTVVNVRAQVKEEEEVEVLGTKKRLLRVDALPDKIEIQGGGVQLPGLTAWLDASRTPIRSMTEIPGLGKVVLYRTSRDVALAPVKVPEKMTDIGVTQSIVLNRRIPRPYETSAVVYRVTLPNDNEPATAFARDARQEIRNVQGKSFELHVKALRAPRGAESGTRPADEFLKSNHFINSADARVQEHARKAVGQESDPWKKAQLIERWVHRNMKVLNFSEAMATADHVARTLEGDCSEYSMLTAAMCRAAGVPSRTALGLVYAELPQQGPVLAYHMWTEVWINGQWLAIDATLGQGSVGACHLKIADHSWHDVQSLTPLLPVMRVTLGKPAIEVLRVEANP